MLFGWEVGEMMDKIEEGWEYNWVFFEGNRIEIVSYLIKRGKEIV